MVKTKDWTPATISSNRPNGTPTVHRTLGNLQISPSITCPALILANSRKHRVIGRTLILVASTILKKGARYHGDPLGSNLELDLFFTKYKSITVPNQKERANERLKASVVVTGYL